MADMSNATVTAGQILGLVAELLETRTLRKYELLEILGDVFEQMGCPRPEPYYLYWTTYMPEEISTDDGLVESGIFISAGERQAFVDGLCTGNEFEEIFFGFAVKEGADLARPRYCDVIWEREANDDE